MHPDVETAASSTAPLDPQLRRRLRELPDAQSPPYEFSEFSRRYSRRRLQETQRPWRLVAAALAVLIGGWVLKHGLTPVMQEPLALQEPRAGNAREAGIAIPEAANFPVLLPTVLVPTVLLPTVNAQRWLDEHPRRALVRVPAQMAVTELEDQIATLDDQINVVQLSRPPARQLALLRRDRAQLVESLAQVRYAQNLVVGLP